MAVRGVLGIGVVIGVSERDGVGWGVKEVYDVVDPDVEGGIWDGGCAGVGCGGCGEEGDAGGGGYGGALEG